jgi:predicted membrane chloride channel (bestrophin family)
VSRRSQEKVEHIGLTIVPLAYAQITRAIYLIFLTLLPFSLVGTMWKYSLAHGYEEEHHTLASIQAYLLVFLISLVTNVTILTIDEVATQLESPFGRSENNIDLEKMVAKLLQTQCASPALHLVGGQGKLRTTRK